MWKSAAGAGIIIALLALLKLQLKAQALAPFPEALLASLNYGLGFVLVHVLHFTIATKQPAMTASRLAEDIERGDGGRANQAKLARTLVDLVRSQLAAVAGNVCVALLLAGMISVLASRVIGAPVLDAESVAYQLHRLEPIGGGALLFAAVAGLWLFLSGVIAGSVDNRAAYLDLRARLTAHPLLQRLISSPTRRARVAEYVHEHYGAIAGNFLFGLLLGMTPWVGSVLGLPLDIRHVAFSSADLGYAAVSGAIGWTAFFTHLGFVLLIGSVNLLVSFWLALWMALRARATRLGSLASLFARFGEQVRANPRLLFVPPRDG
jgi:site-specific recombinase